MSRSRLTFSASSYDREQTVTVSLAKDDDAEPEPAATIVHKVTSNDTAYSTATASSVSVTFKETDTRSVIVTPTSLTVAAGLSGTYKIRLNSQPVSDVTVSVTSDDSGVTVDPSSLTFTSTNWKTAQTATVNVAKSAGGETVKTVTLSHSVAGGRYQDQNPPDVIVTIPLEGAPGAPSGLTATGGDKQVDLAWGPPSNDGGSPVLRYEYRVMQAGAGFSQWTRISGGAGARSHTVTDLANGTSYTFEVRAVNAVGEGPSATATVELADSVPAAPAGFSAAGGDGSVRLTWSAAADGGSQIIRYEYRYRASGGDWGEWTALSATATSVTISDLTNGTEYEFQVRAVNGIGNGPASSTGAPAGTAPSAPVGLSARVGDGMIMVSWGMPSNNGGFPVLRYQLRYRESGATSWTTMTVDGGANATSATLTDLTNGQSYEIEVWAVNRIGGGATASIGAAPMEGMDFAHFANGVSGDVTMTSDIVLVNVETSTVNPAIYFYDQQGGMLDAATVVDATGELAVNGDGVLTVPLGLRGRGEITISTNGQGPLVVGSVKVFAGGRIGGVLRFDIPNLGVAGVGTSEPVTDAIFPARRVAGGINTGAAIRNLSGGPLTVTCGLMKDGRVLDTELVNLAVDGQSARFIDEMFSGADTSDFEGSVRCLAAEGGTFTGLALEMDFSGGQIFTTLPVVPVDAEAADDGESTLNFAHFANGDGGSPITSDLVFVNVANTAVGPAVYFYDQQGGMIDAATLVDAMGGVEVSDSGALTVTDEIPPMGEMTISTNGMGEIVVGSVKVVSDGPIGGVLRFDVPSIGVAGVGASHGFREAIFPARRVDGGINTGAAIRNLGSEATTVTCRLMQDGRRLDETVISLAGNGQSSRFINEMFTGADTSDFEGSVHCAAPRGSSFTGVALEMDFNNRAFTTLPVIRVR